MNQKAASLYPDSLKPRSSSAEDRPPFHLTILYEDYDTGKAAISLYAQLLRQFGNDYALTFNLWRFDVLDLMFLKEVTATDAAKADLIVFSARADFKLTPQLKNWTEAWLSQKFDRESALAVLINPPTSMGTPPIQAYLRDLAHRAGMEFFAPGGHSAARAEFGSPDMIWERAGVTASHHAESLHLAEPPRTSHWGINE